LAKQMPYTDDQMRMLGLDKGRLPRHVAIIMDGNGRWACRQGLRRIQGHAQGVRSVRAVVEECCRLDLRQLTLYCLSVDNWKRPREELDFLFLLLRRYLIEERAEIMEQNIRFASIGRRDGLPPEVLWELDENARLTRDNTGLTLCLAINYGGRTELADAVRTIAYRVRAGELDPADISEQTLAQYLYTRDMPDPDLLIRTAGEMRISNFLLWQLSYTEIWVTDKCWPEFTTQDLHAALADFAKRERRFGGLSEG